MLEVRNLTKVYNDGTVAVDNVSFKVSDGEFLGRCFLAGGRIPRIAWTIGFSLTAKG
jgi:ABC-type uncharacterized transport system ATPase subunit